MKQEPCYCMETACVVACFSCAQWLWLLFASDYERSRPL